LQFRVDSVQYLLALVGVHFDRFGYVADDFVTETRRAANCHAEHVMLQGLQLTLNAFHVRLEVVLAQLLTILREEQIDRVVQKRQRTIQIEVLQVEKTFAHQLIGVEIAHRVFARLILESVAFNERIELNEPRPHVVLQLEQLGILVLECLRDVCGLAARVRYARVQ
jgi:hypothetical protein